MVPPDEEYRVTHLPSLPNNDLGLQAGTHRRYLKTHRQQTRIFTVSSSIYFIIHVFINLKLNPLD